jgi:hypothetical protein
MLATAHAESGNRGWLHNPCISVGETGFEPATSCLPKLWPRALPNCPVKSPKWARTTRRRHLAQQLRAAVRFKAAALQNLPDHIRELRSTLIGLRDPLPPAAVELFTGCSRRRAKQVFARLARYPKPCRIRAEMNCFYGPATSR